LPTNFAQQYAAVISWLEAPDNVWKCVENVASAVRVAATEGYMSQDDTDYMRIRDYGLELLKALEETFAPKLLEVMAATTINFQNKLLGNVGEEDQPGMAALAEDGSLQPSSQQSNEDFEGQQLMTDMTAIAWCTSAIYHLSTALIPERKNAEFLFEIQRRTDIWRLVLQNSADLDPAAGGDSTPVDGLQVFSDLWASWNEVKTISYSTPEAMRASPYALAEDSLGQYGLIVRGANIKEPILKFIEGAASDTNDSKRAVFLEK